MAGGAKVFWNAEQRRWEITGKGGALWAYVSESGFSPQTYVDPTNIRVSGEASLADITGAKLRILGTATLSDLKVGSTAVIQRMAVAGVASLADIQAAKIIGIGTPTMQNLNVGTLATVRAIDVAGVASFGDIQAAKFIGIGTPTMQNLNVGSLATIRDLNVGGVASVSNLEVESGLSVGGTGTPLTRLIRIIGSLPLTNVGTMSVAVVTFAPGSLGVTGDTVFVSPRAALVAGLGIGASYVPSTSTINLQLINVKIDAVASQPAIGIDAFLSR